MYMILPEKKERNMPLQASTGTQKALVLITAQFAAINFSAPTPSLPAAADGPAFLKHPEKVLPFTKKTALMA